ncbi:MAG: rhodanese-like domain-containing protein [Desulfobulbaceae bacterium]|nr:rhodanese-like domain-containing protein [Desulfobulbaceae bacterium]
MKKGLMTLCMGCALVLLSGHLVHANEVDKGGIPAAELDSSFKKMSWGSPVWDNADILQAYNDGTKMLLVDTRPESFFKKGTLRNAVLLAFDKSDSADNGLTEASLSEALAKAGMTKENAKIVMFCQGPKCHRSYNASFVAVSKWGYSPDSVIWYRDGYPNLVKEIQGDAKLKRKANKYLSEEAMKSL